MAFNLELAQAIIKGHRRNMALADSLVTKHRIAEIHAVSAGIKHNRVIAASSINDAIASQDAIGIFNDWPEARAEILRLSALVNGHK